MAESGRGSIAARCQSCSLAAAAGHFADCEENSKRGGHVATFVVAGSGRFAGDLRSRPAGGTYSAIEQLG